MLCKRDGYCLNGIKTCAGFRRIYEFLDWTRRWCGRLDEGALLESRVLWVEEGGTEGGGVDGGRILQMRGCSK